MRLALKMQVRELGDISYHKNWLGRSQPPQKNTKRGFIDIKEPKVAVITGASRGIGYASALDLVSRLSSGHVYLTTRGDPDILTRLVRERVGPAKAEMVNFHMMDVTNAASIAELARKVEAEQGKVDILINNAGLYFCPSPDPEEHLKQVVSTLATNYWGLKTVCQTFLPLLDPVARVVNLSSHLGHLSLILGSDLKERFAPPSLTQDQLDLLMLEYQNHWQEFVKQLHTDTLDHWQEPQAGWPACAYTVSKVAVNAYTSLLQEELDEGRKQDVVVNCLHPGSYHRRIKQESPLTVTDAAKSVICMALLAHPCDHPRGKFLWHDLQSVSWDKGDLSGMWP